MTDLWHPDDNECALFIEGALDKATTARIAGHLATCNDCVEVIGGGAGAMREEVRVWWKQPVVLATAAAVVIVLIGLAIFQQQRKSSGIAAMAAAAKGIDRPAMLRLSAFPYGEYHTFRGGGTPEEPEDAKQYRLQAAAFEAVEGGRPSAAGVGCIVLHENKAAIDWLTKAAQRDPKDAHVWNDLAAAQYANGNLTGARASIERALKLDPHLADAQFNRALILEHLDLRQQALDAWRAYLKTDRNSGWAGEAQRHIDDLMETP